MGSAYTRLSLKRGKKSMSYYIPKLELDIPEYNVDHLPKADFDCVRNYEVLPELPHEAELPQIFDFW
jgi:nitrogen fixation protein